MKKIHVLIILFLSFLMVSCSNNSKLYPVTNVEENNLGYKFVDKKTTKVIDNIYEDVILNFDSKKAKDYAIVIDDGKIEIINKKGESIVDIGFQNVAEIYGDRAILVKDGKNVLYDLKNKKEIFTHDYIKSESNGVLAFMESGKWGYRNEAVIICEPFYDEAYSFGEKYGVATKDGASYKVDKNGMKTEIPFSEVVQASGSNYLIGLNNGRVSLLNLDGEIIFADIKGDIVDVNHDMLLIMMRNDGKIKQSIYSVDGKEIQPAIYDDVRLLSKKYFSAKENSESNFALYNIDGTKLTENKYSYLNADYFDENGGIITAISEGFPKYLDKNGVELDGPILEKVVDVIKDKNFYILKTSENTCFYSKDKELAYISANPIKIGEIYYIINPDTNAPTIFNDKLDSNINKDIQNELNKITSNKREYDLKLRGDILDIKLKFESGEVSFMYDISTANKVELSDIFVKKNIAEILLGILKLDKKFKIVGFVLDDDLKLTLNSGDKFINKVIDYEKIEPYINKDGGTFFKSVLAPSINVERK